MNKKTLWRSLTVLTVVILVSSFVPEVRMLGFLIDAVGLDVFILLLEIQLSAFILIGYRRYIYPCLSWAEWAFSKYDPYFFIPSKELVKKYPPILAHSVPFYVAGILFVLGTLPLNA